jgi:GNAT superfamily N-acetyltransferase
MDIPDLPPDVSFDRLPHTPEARDFAFEVKRAAIGPHIIERWGWDEAFQRNFHEQRFKDTPLSRIMLKGQAVGTIALTALTDHLRLDEFYLLSPHQGQGSGTRILNPALLSRTPAECRFGFGISSGTRWDRFTDAMGSP